MKKEFMLGALCLGMVLVAAPLWAADAPTTAAPATGHEEESATEVNKKLSNPVSSIWSISFQQNNYMLDMGPGKEAQLLVTPVIPKLIKGTLIN